jgi:hypothetical protein
MEDSVLCPVKAYRRMCVFNVAPSVSHAFVVLKNSKLVSVSYPQLQTSLKALVLKSGQNPDSFSSHSLRRGGATWAFQAGVPGELIQLQGDWHSDAYLEYLRFSFVDKLRVSQRMCDLIRESCA